ncbi:MAG: tyrosine-type recombinase/integrase [Bacteroidia bacterium]|nr:tyrosine-type recombinase/integrase [Bacteroidia bacterium]
MLLLSFFDYLKYEKNYSSHTLQAYQRDLEQLRIFLEKSGIDLNKPSDIKQLNHKDLREWALELVEKDQASSTLKRKLSSIRTFFHYVQREGHISYNPAEKIQLPKQEKKLPTFLKPDETRFLFEEIDFPNDFEGVRDRCILEILYGCGIRRSELLSLSDEDIDMYAQQIKVIGKGSKERIVPFGKVVKASIEAYFYEKSQLPEADKSCFIVRKNGHSAYPKLLYNVVNKWISKVSSLNQKGPHTLRHTYATHMLDEGADLNAIKELLGHKSLASTQVYTHNSISKLKKIYKQAHPKAD